MGKHKIPHDFVRILREMYPENSIALLLCFFTGLPVSRILQLRPADLTPDGIRVGLRRYYLPPALRASLRRICGTRYIFSGRLAASRHRTRQAVYKDIRRAMRDIGSNQELTPRMLSLMFEPLM